MNNKYESVEQLVSEKRGYKYLNLDNTSPYQSYYYDLVLGKLFETKVDTNIERNCGSGWNLATLDWILDNQNIFTGKIVEFIIPEDALIIVPNNNEGKFRTNKIIYKREMDLKEKFNFIFEIKSKLDKYVFINPIQAEEMPDIDKVKSILFKIRNQVGNQVGNQVWDQVRNQVGNQVWNQVGNQVGNQVWDQVGNQVWDQVGNQINVISYFAIKEFFNLKYAHSIFDLIRLGILVVNIDNKFKVFGKDGKFLGEIQE